MDGALSGRVVRISESAAAHTKLAADRDDTSAARRHHAGQDRPAQIDKAAEVNVEHPARLSRSESRYRRRFVVTGGRHGRRDRSEVAFDRSDRLSDGASVSHVNHTKGRGAGSRVKVERSDSPPSGDELVGDPCADPAGGASDDDCTVRHFRPARHRRRHHRRMHDRRLPPMRALSPRP